MRFPVSSAYKLCLVQGDCAWFTTQELKSQWGDDWGESGYEIAAGPPHQYTKYDKEDSLEPWQIARIKFSGSFLLPHDPPAPKSWSVKSVNEGLRPWLRGTGTQGTALMAGASVEEFCQFVLGEGGQIVERPTNP